MAKEPKEGAGRREDWLGTQIILSLISIALGAILLFAKSFSIGTLCYVFSIALIFAGVACVARFFLKKGYRSLRDYNFSIGVLLILLGIVGLIRNEALAGEFQGYLAFVVMVLGVILLQGAVQMRIMESNLWVVNLIFTIIVLAAGTIVLAGSESVFPKVEGFVYWALLVAGALSLISLVMVSLTIRSWTKKRDRLRESQEAELREAALAKARAEAAAQAAEEAAASAESAAQEAQESAGAQTETAAPATAQAVNDPFLPQAASPDAQPDAAAIEDVISAAAGQTQQLREEEAKAAEDAFADAEASLIAAIHATGAQGEEHQ